MKDEPSVEDVLGTKALETLGEPDVIHSPKSVKGPSNLELREYSDPDLTALTGVAYNLSSQVVPARDLNGDSSDERIWREALNNFRSLVREGPENPVFVSDEVLQFFEDDDLVPAAVKFSDDETHPASLRPVETYFDKVEDSGMFEEVDFEEYRNDVEYRSIRNRFLVPALVDESGNPVRSRTAAILYSESSDTALDTDEAYGQEFLEPEEARPQAEAGINYHLVETGDSYFVTAESESDEFDAWVEEGTLHMDYGDAVAVVDDLEGEVEQIDENNGVYDIEVS